jgi:hypothetical protein
MACSRCSTSMTWGWWLPGTPGIPAAGMFMQMIEYRHPVAFSKAVRFLACRRAGFVRRTIHRSPSGHRPARLIRCVISATCLSSCTSPSWSRPGCQAVAGSILIASSSAGVIIHPQVNGTVRRGVASDSRCAISSWLAPAPSTRTSSRDRNRAGTCAIAAASTSRQRASRPGTRPGIRPVMPRPRQENRVRRHGVSCCLSAAGLRF